MKVLLIDDHPLYRTGFQTALARATLRYVVLTASSAANALNLLQREPDIQLVIVDWHLAGDDGLQALQQLGQQFPAVARVLISGADDIGLADRALQAGASGFIPKSFTVEQIVAALDMILSGALFVPAVAASTPTVTAGAPHLTLRQLEMISLLGHGLSNKEMARELQLAERTVKAHLTSLFGALGVSNRTQAILAAQRQGLLPPT